MFDSSIKYNGSTDIKLRAGCLQFNNSSASPLSIHNPKLSHHCTASYALGYEQLQPQIKKTHRFDIDPTLKCRLGSMSIREFMLFEALLDFLLLPISWVIFYWENDVISIANFSDVKPRVNECLVSYICLEYERKLKRSDPISVKCELNLSKRRKQYVSRDSLYKCMHQIGRICLNSWGHESRTPLAGAVS